MFILFGVTFAFFFAGLLLVLEALVGLDDLRLVDPFGRPGRTFFAPVVALKCASIRPSFIAASFSA